MLYTRRITKSLNLLSKKYCNQSKWLRKLSTDRQKTHSLYFSKIINNDLHLNGNVRCSVYKCMPDRRYSIKTNIVQPDNIVISPYDDVSVPNKLLHEVVWDITDRFSNLTALECSLTGRKYTFAQLRQKSRQFGAALLKAGVRPRETISVLLPNIPEFPIVLLGALEAGIIVSTINPVYTSEEVQYHLKDSNSVCVVTFADRLNVAQEAKARIQEETKGKLNINIISIQDYDGTSRPHPEGVWSFAEMVEKQRDTSALDSACREYDIRPDDVAILPYSSGTTGLPKGVCLTHKNIVSNMLQIEIEECRHIILPSGDFQDVLPAILPFFHIYGLHVILLQSIRNGAKLITMPKFEPKSFVNVLKKEHNTILYLVPPLILFIGMNPEITNKDLERVRFFISGAAPVGQSDLERCLSKMPDSTCVLQAFGMTETSPVVLLPSNKKSDNLSTVGKPTSMTKVKVIDDKGKNLGVGESGELCIYGPQVMKGYHNKPESTANTIDKDGWLYSGDIGYFDRDGNFYIVDRKKELIKVKGFQVAPAELEELLRINPAVADAAVIGVPDERAGEVPVAFIVPKTGQKEVTPDSIKSFIAKKVADYKHLSQVFIVNSIPKSASGKILRRQLKELHENSVKGK